MFDAVDYGSWFQTYLAPDALSAEPEMKVIRRTVAYVISQFVDYPQDRTPPMPQVVHVLCYLLRHGEDMCVRIQTTMALRNTIENLYFQAAQFLPYLNAAFTGLFDMVASAEAENTALKVLTLISVIAETLSGCNEAMQPYTKHILASAASLWTGMLGTEEMVRAAIVSTLSAVISQLGADPQDIEQVILPILAQTMAPNSKNACLQEEGVVLWVSVVQSSPTMTPLLLDAFQVAPQYPDVDTLPNVIALVDAYVLLGGGPFLQRYTAQVTSFLDFLFANALDTVAIGACELVESILRACPADSFALLSPVLRIMLTSTLSTASHGSNDNSHTHSQYHNPHSFEGDYVDIDGDGSISASPLVKGCYFAILCRVLAQSQDQFWQLFTHVVSTLPPAPEGETYLGVFLDTLIETIDSVGLKPFHKKCCAIALASILPNAAAEIESRFATIVGFIIDSVLDIESDPPSLMHGFEKLLVEAREEAELPAPIMNDSKRRREALMQDALFQLNLRDHFMAKGSELQQRGGQDKFNALMGTLSPALWQRFQLPPSQNRS
eukprot:TRINITY_DN18629_c0_g1::TRINITY_DN18629_c0_g1_i1::g.1182::m.1182 TRINITY_DN18629_c0_g1::TRINITY_DN18629_c0_g1_i1::g.1182  ORF type:complete len:625 (-),score=120.96,sp/Q9UI26/IPO11_HUMAN/25.44/3e-50,CAS_CSE1/PF03378.10/64,CAS_CSE1/PF03378.10/1.3,HEAT_2/PF13646.1/7.6e+03,HEAT_2/PF13646.1/2.8,HEAT_2/PF13646.1/3.9e+02 TRINITY_DN18629_c0_g1_i1:14-1669(-)